MAAKDCMSRYFPESEFGGFTDLDGTIAFFLHVNSLIRGNDTVLDVGCGRGEYADDSVAMRRDLRSLKGKCEKVIGIDVDPVADTNPCIDEFRIISDSRWPIDDSSIDVCVTDFVVEHVADPDDFFSEAFRVLKPGGFFCIRTSNAVGYVGIGSRLIPNTYHSKVVDKVQDSREEEDVFPTYYRCNTVWKLRRLLKNHGFQGCAYGYEAEPAYLAFSRIAYYLGTLHQKFAPQSLKVTIFAFGKKQM